MLSGPSEGHLVAHGLELVECPVLGAFGVQAGEEVGAGVLVEGAVAEAASALFQVVSQRY